MNAQLLSYRDIGGAEVYCQSYNVEMWMGNEDEAPGVRL
jgi:hypothetical protein